MIPNVVLQIALKCIDHGMNITDAVNSKRIHHGWMPDYTLIEEGGFGSETIAEYKAMGYTVYDEDTCCELGITYRPPRLGTAMCIQIDWENHVFYGAADPRSGDPSVFSVGEMN